jgi:cobalamin biosynthesis Mg chelatase CobN
MHKEQGHTVESAVEARAGFRERPVLVVLVVSVLLVCVLFALIYMGFFAR